MESGNISQVVPSHQLRNSSPFTSYRGSGISSIRWERSWIWKFTSKDIEGIDMDDEMPEHELIDKVSGQCAWLFPPGDFFKGTRDLAVVDPVKKELQFFFFYFRMISGDWQKPVSLGSFWKVRTWWSIYLEELAWANRKKLYITIRPAMIIYRYDYCKRFGFQLFSFHPLFSKWLNRGPGSKTKSLRIRLENVEMEKTNHPNRIWKLLWDEKVSDS